jgi:hypothetical protein
VARHNSCSSSQPLAALLLPLLFAGLILSRTSTATNRASQQIAECGAQRYTTSAHGPPPGLRSLRLSFHSQLHVVLRNLGGRQNFSTSASAIFHWLNKCNPRYSKRKIPSGNMPTQLF